MQGLRNQLLLRTYLVLGMFVLFAMLVYWRAFKISMIEGEEWKKRKQDLYVKEVAIEAERGNIYADNGNLLSTSLQFFDVRMDFQARGLTDKAFYSGVDSLAICIHNYINPEKSITYYKNWLVGKRKASSGNRYVLLTRGASFEELERIKRFPILRRGANAGGLIVEQYGKRELPFGSLAQRTIGYQREDHGVGLEGNFETFLKGEQGVQYMQKVGPSEFVPLGDVSRIDPHRGSDLNTTIDIGIQDVTHQALLSAMEKHDAEWGTAVVMEVETGAIKAISNLTQIENGKWAEIYNHAIGTLYEPGSTFKLASLMALLEDGKIDLDDSVEINKGSGRFCGVPLKDSEPHNIVSTDVKTAFAMSSNVGMAKLVNSSYSKKGDARRFIQRLKQFGINKKTNIEIEGEGEPYLKDAYSKEDKWSCTSLPWMSIGYELQVTPLQILTLYNGVANQGHTMKPYIVKSIMNDGEVIEEYSPKRINNNIASKNTIIKVKEALKEVVETGTGRRIKSPYYSISGKTGTSQVGYNNKDEKLEYQSSFVGFFPSEKPKYSCVVVVHKPQKNGYYGGSVAGPVFKAIADQCMRKNLEFENPFEKQITKQHAVNAKLLVEHKVKKSDFLKLNKDWAFEFDDQSESEWIYTKSNADTLIGLPFFLNQKKIPDLRGMALKDALYLLENAGLKVDYTGFGKVKSQSLDPGTDISNQVIHLRLG